MAGLTPREAAEACDLLAQGIKVAQGPAKIYTQLARVGRTRLQCAT